MSVQVLWDATADVPAFTLPQNHSGAMDWTPQGGLHNNAGAGKTGNILFTTTGHAVGDTYTVTLYMHKVYASAQ